MMNPVFQVDPLIDGELFEISVNVNACFSAGCEWDLLSIERDCNLLGVIAFFWLFSCGKVFCPGVSELAGRIRQSDRTRVVYPVYSCMFHFCPDCYSSVIKTL
jgi:hypothetical protein